MKLRPDAVQAPVLEHTLVSINEAADQVPQEAFARFGLRAPISNWSFHRLGAFLAHKAQRAGAPLVVVDPPHTSRMRPAPWCGHTGRGDRRTRCHFPCRHCGFAGPADEVAAVNVRARRARAFLDVPAPHPA